jgi:hypothetical protein
MNIGIYLGEEDWVRRSEREGRKDLKRKRWEKR